MFKRALILAPHIDDGELGCGGTISRFVRNKTAVYYAAFSAAEQSSISKGMLPDILRKEVIAATEKLGIAQEFLRLYSYEVRNFGLRRQEILEDLIILKDEVKPDVVFIPSLHDIHQDHQVLSHEAIRAFKTTTIFGYEMPWNNLTIDTTCFIRLSEEDVNNKVLALQCYKSQIGRTYFHPEFIRSLLMTRGVQVGCDFAETFEVVRYLI